VQIPKFDAKPNHNPNPNSNPNPIRFGQMTLRTSELSSNNTRRKVGLTVLSISLKSIRADTVQSPSYDFLLVIPGNHEPLVPFLR